MTRRPNILFAIADDASHMGAYGHQFVNTPNFDKVAQLGVLCNNAFTTNPKCAPSRASILTGMHTWQLEDACTHYGYFPNKFPVYPDLLEDSGYYIGYTGKGWGPGDWKKNGLKRNPAGVAFNHHTLTPPKNTGISSIDYTANFVEFLDHKPKDVPFYFWFGCHEPHRVYVKGEGTANGKQLQDVVVPEYLPNDDIVKSDLCDYAYEVEWFDKQLGYMLDHLESMGELDNTIIVVTSDNGAPFPRIKGQMYEQDFKLPLAICWTDKVKGNRVIDDLISFIDFAPTFLDIAGIKIPIDWPGRSLTDILYSDKEEVVNTNRDRVFMGRERHDMGREGDLGYPVRCIRTHKYLYSRNFEPDRWPAGNPETEYTNCDGSPTKEFILRQHTQGYNYYYNLAFAKHAEEELYDIELDPYCMSNLAYKQSYMGIKNKLWVDLKSMLDLTGDPRIHGNGDIFDAYDYVGDAPHSWGHYIKGDWKKQNY